MTEGTCSCAERTGELVVFTCPVCVGRVQREIRYLTNRGLLVRFDKSGSVSGTVEVEENWWLDGKLENSP